MLAAIVAVLAFATASCGDEADQGLPSPTVAESAGPSILILPLGRTARSEEAEITIHRVRRSGDEQGSRPPEGREWMLVEVSVFNTSSQAVRLLIQFRDRNEDDLDRAYPPGVEEALDSPVAPGASVRGEVAFLAPRGMVGGTIVYGPGDIRWALQMGMFPVDE